MASLLPASNLVHRLHSFQLSSSVEKPSKLIRSCLGECLEQQCTDWTVAHTASCFTRRITSIRWHPHHPYVIAYGTHGGDILLWDYTKPLDESPKIRGIGMGYGCITEMRFHPHNPHFIYTTAVDGRFSLQDFEGRRSQIFLDKPTGGDHWWCALDLSVDLGVVVVGDNRGSAMLQDLKNSNITISKCDRLHKGKIKGVEFCPIQSWMFATSSTDHTVKLWDIRMLRSTSISLKPKPLSTAEHSGLVSSAFFDPIYGDRLLTTSQDGQIRTYGSHDLWQDPITVISHPHRNFQHMTDIKATWHPLYSNVCVVGRYPRKDDPNQSRTIDLINVETGKALGCFYSPYLSGIIQLNQFNKLGDSLASGMGYNGLIWKAVAEKEGALKEGSYGDSVIFNGGRAKKKKNPPNNKHLTKKKIKLLIDL